MKITSGREGDNPRRTKNTCTEASFAIMVATTKLFFLSFIFFIFNCLCLDAATVGSVVTLSTLVSPQSELRNLSRRASSTDEVDILPPTYYRHIAPSLNGEPVRVKVSVVILSMTVSSGSDQVSF